jgi:hypothetical protein
MYLEWAATDIRIQGYVIVEEAAEVHWPAVLPESAGGGNHKSSERTRAADGRALLFMRDI